MKTVVLGLGQVGLPTALFMKQSGLDTIGYDVAAEAVDRAKAKGLNATLHWDDIPNSENYIVCVSTLLKGDKPDLTAIYDSSRKIGRNAKAGSLVSVESTIPVGVCRKIRKEFLKEQHLVHVPHRYWEGDSVNHGVKQKRVIGSVDEKSLEHGVKFYRDILNIPLHIASSIEVAEMSKIAENAYRYVQIAFAQELCRISNSVGVDFKEIREACNTKWNIDIYEARGGIGGHCLPKDVQYLANMTHNHPLIEGAIKSNETYVRWLKKR